MKNVYVFDCNSDVVWCFASCIDFEHFLLYTKSHDFATLEAGLSFGCDSVRYTSVKKVYVFDCNSDVVWCFASCTDFVHILLYTTIHDFATLEAGLSFGCDSVRYTVMILLHWKQGCLLVVIQM